MTDKYPHPISLAEGESPLNEEGDHIRSKTNWKGLSWLIAGLIALLVMFAGLGTLAFQLLSGMG